MRHICTVFNVNMNGYIWLPFNLSANRLKGNHKYFQYKRGIVTLTKIVVNYLPKCPYYLLKDDLFFKLENFLV